MSADDPPPDIRTERLRLVTLWRGIALARLDGRRQDAGVRFTEDWPGDALPLLLALARSDDERADGTYVIVLDDAAIGMIGTKGRPSGGVVEIGYGLVQAARGRGYATEALAALATLLGDRGLVVTAFTQEGNTPSERVLTRCGFTRGALHDQRDGPPVTDWVLPPTRRWVPGAQPAR